jgi:hypothetical protein
MQPLAGLVNLGNRNFDGSEINATHRGSIWSGELRKSDLFIATVPFLCPDARFARLARLAGFEVV